MWDAAPEALRRWMDYMLPWKFMFQGNGTTVVPRTFTRFLIEGGSP